MDAKEARVSQDLIDVACTADAAAMARVLANRVVRVSDLVNFKELDGTVSMVYKSTNLDYYVAQLTVGNEVTFFSDEDALAQTIETRLKSAVAVLASQRGDHVCCNACAALCPDWSMTRALLRRSTTSASWTGGWSVICDAEYSAQYVPTVIAPASPFWFGGPPSVLNYNSAEGARMAVLFNILAGMGQPQVGFIQDSSFGG
jgi:hypothetical protein